jgi:hypothetical protein
LEEIVAASVKKTENTTGGIRCADHATPSIRKSWYYLAKKRRSLGLHSSLADQSHGVFFLHGYQTTTKSGSIIIIKISGSVNVVKSTHIQTFTLPETVPTQPMCLFHMALIILEINLILFTM